MSRMALIGLVVIFVTGTVGAGLCDLSSGAPVTVGRVDLADNWQDHYLDRFQHASRGVADPVWALSCCWDAAPLRSHVTGADVDRWWYAYLDRGRYRYLDETQYALLDGPAGLWWRRRYRAWLEAVHLSWSVPVAPTRDAQYVIPEPGSAALLALGAFLAWHLSGAGPATRMRSPEA